MMKKYSKKVRFAVTYAIILAAFTLYAALDTFVIARTYSAEGVSPTGNAAVTGTANATTGTADGGYAVILPSGEEDSGQSGQNMPDNGTQDTGEQDAGTSGVKISADSYSDGNITIDISTFEVYGTTVHAADIQLSSAQYLKTALANGAYGRNIKATVSQTAAENNAILAINGDFYGSQQSGYVVRNGVLYRGTAKRGQEDLVIYADGCFEIITESEVSAQELMNRGAVQVLSFGPALVENGTISVTANDEVGKAMASNPRTAIGIIDDTHYVMVVSDGRTSDSEGLSLLQLAQVMQSLGCHTAYNLDGGGSSTMVFNGNVINTPSNGGGRERSVSDIVYIGY